MRRLIVEFLGTFFLILTIALTGNAIAIAAMLMAWVYIGGYISGGHYNPAVSLGTLLIGRLRQNEFFRYLGAQVLGGFAAYAVAYYLRGSVAIPEPSVAMLPAFIVEVLLAFVFVLLVLVVTHAERFKGSHIFGFAIGFAVPALVLAGSPLSGGLFNPAIALGSNLFGIIKGAHIVWADILMYVGGAFFGGFLAAWVYKYLGFDEKK